MKMNKKTIIIIVVAVIVVLAAVIAIVLGGGNKETPTTTTTTTTTTTGNGGSSTPAGDYTLGMGTAFGEMKNGEINATIAVVVLDAEGKIVNCRIDAVQNKFTLDMDNETITFTSLDSKLAKGDNYNMATWGKDQDNNGDGVVLEWYKQVEVFENYVIGMTAEQVAAIPQKTLGDEFGATAGYVIAADDELLSAGCTIQIQEFINAIVKACNDEQGTSFKTSDSFTLGIAAHSEDNHSNPSKFTEDGAVVSMDVAYAGTVVSNGKILASLNDAFQPVVTIDWDGNVVSANVGKSDLTTWQDLGLMTKRELKENYAMAAWGTSLVGNEKAIEWYVQSAAFSKHIVGMTADQVTNMPTQTMSNGYVISNDQTLLDAGCTMAIPGIQAVVVASMSNAR